MMGKPSCSVYVAIKVCANLAQAQVAAINDVPVEFVASTQKSNVPKGLPHAAGTYSCKNPQKCKDLKKP